MVNDDPRTSGSSIEFEQDWQLVLEEAHPEYLVTPSKDTGRQSDLLEWIKVRQIERFLAEVGLRHGRMLEYGCGAAGVSLYFAGRGYETHICDLSAKALKVAALNQERNFVPAQLASTSVANVFQLPYASASFDVVMSYGLLEHFSAAALRGLLAESIRVLRPGGLFIADIVPGPERWNARTLGNVANWLAATLYHAGAGRIGEARQRFRRYFDYYFETTFDDRTWTAILAQHPLEDVRVDVCRPFPILAIGGALEKQYTRFMLKMLPFHERFDGANTWFSRRWGWMYLARARKKGSVN
jgi:SAM-dependent methyltransferase